MASRARRAARPLGVLASLCVAAALLPASGATAAEGDELTIFGINDFHGRTTSTAEDLACTLETERAGAADSVFISSGDNIGASEFSSYLQEDQPTIEYLNALELDASALGNHEFDKGADDLTGRVMGQADFPYLGANVLKADGTPFTGKAYEIITTGGGKKVAVVGAVTQSTPSLVSPGGVKGLTFTDPVAAVNQTIADLKASGVDYDLIVVSYHDGGSSDATLGTAPADAGSGLLNRIVTETSSDADAIFTAHTHRTYAYEAPKPDGNGTRPIIQTGSYGENLGAVTLVEGADGGFSLADGGLRMIPTGGMASGDTGETCAQFPRYNAAVKIATAAQDKATEAARVPVGTVNADITTAFNASKAEYVNGVWTRIGTDTAKRGDDRAASSALSNLVADSMVWSLSQDDYAGKPADLGVMLPGSVREDLLHAPRASEGDGVVTYGEANDVVPFLNPVVTVDLTGAQLFTMLEQQWQRDADGNVPSRSYLQLGLSSNVDYTFDASAPEGERITSITIDGKPVEEDAVYTVAVQGFLAEGGDNFHVFLDGANVTDTGYLDRDSWIDFLKNNQNLEPDFSQRGVGVTVQPNPDGSMPAGTQADPWTLRITNLHSTSLGAPMITGVVVSIDGHEYRGDYVQGEDGQWYADVTIWAPDASEEGQHELLITALPDTGTAVGYPVVIQASDGSSTIEPGPGQPADPGGPSAPSAPEQPGSGSGSGSDAGTGSDGANAPGAGPDTPGEASAPGAGSRPDAPGGANAPGTGNRPTTQPDAATPGLLPRTGLDIAPYAAVTIVLLSVGVAAVMVARRLRDRA